MEYEPLLPLVNRSMQNAVSGERRVAMATGAALPPACADFFRALRIDAETVHNVIIRDRGYTDTVGLAALKGDKLRALLGEVDLSEGERVRIMFALDRNCLPNFIDTAERFLRDNKLDPLVAPLTAAGFQCVDDLMVLRRDFADTHPELRTRDGFVERLRRLLEARQQSQAHAAAQAAHIAATAAEAASLLYIRVEVPQRFATWAHNVITAAGTPEQYGAAVTQNLVALLTKPASDNVGRLKFVGPAWELSQDSLRLAFARDTADEGEVLEFAGGALSVAGDEDGHLPPPAGFSPSVMWKAPNRVRVVAVSSRTAVPPRELPPSDIPTPLYHAMMQLFGNTKAALPKIQKSRFETATAIAQRAIFGTDNDKDLSRLLNTLVEPLTQSADFKDRNVNGALLWGPPGSAKSVTSALIAQFGFLTCFSGNLVSFSTGIQDSSAEGMRELFAFTEHWKHLPALVIADEIDRILERRGRGGGSSVQNQQENALATVLTKLTSAEFPNLTIVGSTNMYHKLDPAAVRPGRIALHCYFGRMKPSTAIQFLAHKLAGHGFDNSSTRLLRLGQEFDDARASGTSVSHECAQIVAGVFNLTGANLVGAFRDAVKVEPRLKPTDPWETVKARLLTSLNSDSIRQTIHDPSAMGILPEIIEERAVLHGPAHQLSRQIAVGRTQPKLRAFTSLMLCCRQTGATILEGTGTNHLAFHAAPADPRRVARPLSFIEFVQAVVLATNADMMDIIDARTLPQSAEDIGSFAEERALAARSSGAAMLVAINVDSILSLNVELSTGDAESKTMGGGRDEAVALSEGITRTVGEASGTTASWGTDRGYNVGTTVGANQTSGNSIQAGLLWNTYSWNSSDATHRDVTTGTTHSFNEGQQRSNTTSIDHAESTDRTVTTAQNENWSQQTQRTVTRSIRISNPDSFDRLMNFIETLRRAAGVLVAVVSAYEQLVEYIATTRLQMQAPEKCALCKNWPHDPTTLLVGTQGIVPLCYHCFREGRARGKHIAFDSGNDGRQVDQALRLQYWSLRAVEHVEVTAVRGLWPEREPTALACVLQRIRDGEFPSLTKCTIHDFGDYELPAIPGALVSRVPPVHLLNVTPDVACDHIARVHGRQFIGGRQQLEAVLRCDPRTHQFPPSSSAGARPEPDDGRCEQPEVWEPDDVSSTRAATDLLAPRIVPADNEGGFAAPAMPAAQLRATFVALARVAEVSALWPDSALARATVLDAMKAWYAGFDAVDGPGHSTAQQQRWDGIAAAVTAAPGKALAEKFVNAVAAESRLVAHPSIDLPTLCGITVATEFHCEKCWALSEATRTQLQMVTVARTPTVPLRESIMTALCNRAGVPPCLPCAKCGSAAHPSTTVEQWPKWLVVVCAEGTVEIPATLALPHHGEAKKVYANVSVVASTTAMYERGRHWVGINFHTGQFETTPTADAGLRNAADAAVYRAV
jgi:hypothetical protein